MDDQRSARKRRLSFTLRDLFWLIALAAIVTWWCVDRWLIGQRLSNLEEFNTPIIQREKDMGAFESRLQPVQKPSDGK
jgi:hypothetical protein